MLLSTDGCPSYTDIAPAHSPPIALRSSKVFLLEICKYFANLDLAGSSGSNPEKMGELHHAYTRFQIKEYLWI